MNSSFRSAIERQATTEPLKCLQQATKRSPKMAPTSRTANSSIHGPRSSRMRRSWCGVAALLLLGYLSSDLLISKCHSADNEQSSGQLAPTSQQPNGIQLQQQLLLLLQQVQNSNHSSSNGGASGSVQRRDLASSMKQQQQRQDDSTIAARQPTGVERSAATMTAPSTNGTRITPPVCQVKDGESVAIVEIEESRGSDMSQMTNPNELPIGGSVEAGEIELKIESETHKYFRIHNKSLVLTRPLDRDATLKENSTQIAQQAITSIYLQISCVDKRPLLKSAANQASGNARQQQQQQQKKVIIPVLVKVLDLNDQAPKFTQPHYSVQVNELAPVGTIVLDQLAYAIDLDSANNGQIEYSLLGQAAPQLASFQSAAAAPSMTTIVSGQPPTSTTSSWQPDRNSLGKIAATSQRLIQRTPQAITSSATTTSSSTSTTTQSSAEPPSSSSHATLEVVSSSSSPQTPPDSRPTEASQSVSSVSSDIVSSSGETSLASSTSSSPTNDAPPVASVSSAQDQQLATSVAPSASSHSATPTINLNSEPIVNGPMDDSDEDESDETLLASMNANSTDLEHDDSEREPEMAGTNGGLILIEDSASGPLAILERARHRLLGANFESDSHSMASARRRRRRRRHLSSSTTTSVGSPLQTSGESRQKKLPMTTISSGKLEVAQAASTQQPPWTNLMMIMPNANEDLASSKLKHLDDDDTLLARANQDDDANEYFALELAPQTGRPVIKLKKQLDYETKRLHRLTLVASDRASNKQERLSSQVQIIVRVLDGDDQPPAFILDQVGCATGSLPRSTTPLSASSIQISTTPSPPPSSTPPSSGQDSTNSTGSLQQEDLMQLDSQVRPKLNPPKVHQLSEQMAAGTSASSSSPQLRSFRVTDENFDFSDTLALDDTPLDEQQQPAATVVLSSSDAAQPGAGRGRRVGLSDQMSTNQQQQLAARQPHLFGTNSKLRPYDMMTDYLCLSSSTGGTSGQQQQNSSEQAIEYFASVISGDSDYLLRVAPQSIKARDRDELNAPIRYSFINGTPANFSHYFHINPLDATIKQVQPVERVHVNEFVLFVKAEEQSYNRLFSVAKLIIDVLPTDKNPPVLQPNAYAGFVDENSPVGSRVFISPEAPADDSTQTQRFMRINVIDVDQAASGHRPLDQKTTSAGGQKQLSYEFDTTSDAFKVDRDGFVFVNRFPLDRDAANQAVHMFQVTARQAGLMSSRSVSSPISLNITLNDLNDNPPILLNSTLNPIQMAANTRGGAHLLTQIAASDRDTAENSRHHFSLVHVSNNGAARFRIEPESGRIEALGKFQAGEQFSLTVRVADELQRAEQGILDVQVIPGANSGGPQFIVEGNELRDNARGYSVEINEGIALNSVVLQVRAQDPENDPITYSLIDGNINGDFVMNSRTGAIQVAKRLDREEISAYRLIVQARDSGGLATSRPVHITVTDSNDQNPVFSQSRYVFSVDEGTSGQLLGRVVAQDGDEGDNGRVSYSLLQLRPAYAGELDSPADRLEANDNDDATNRRPPTFAIDENTGDIRLLEPLDYEEARSHVLLVVARDHGEEARSSSAQVQVRVMDKQDELPYFERFHIESKVEENLGQQRVALVQARDPDSVAQITYVLLAGDSNLFQVDPQTGIVSTTAAGLDYEQSRLHTLLVGTNESLNAGLDVVRVAQRLSDTIAAASNGNGGAAMGDHQAAKLQKALMDSEKTSSALNNRWPIVRIDVQVQDLNDEAPQFELPHPLPVRIQDSASLGTVLAARLQARDRDGSQANSLIRYELVTTTTTSSSSSQTSRRNFGLEQPLVTSDKCAELFLVDASSGQISVRADLKRTSLSECQLVIRAHDLPTSSQSEDSQSRSMASGQQLSSTSVLTVFIDHLVEISPASMISFADSAYTVELAENAPAGTLVKLLPILNKPKVVFPLSCELLSGNELGKFQVIENEQRDCELRTRDQPIDFEQRQRYNLVVKLNTIGSSSSTSSGPTRAITLAQVQVNVLDKNDNKPTFSVPTRYAHLTQGRFLAAISSEAPSETQVLQVRASDADSSQSNGLISYELLNEQELEGRFKVDPVDGIVRTSRPVEDLPRTRLPLKLKLVARDNPEQASESLETPAEIVLNLIDDQHRVALVLKETPAGRVLEQRDELLRILQERTGLIAGLERVESLKVQRNATPVVEADVSGADVWFYLIEPGTMRIVASDDPRLKGALFDGRAQQSLADIIGQSLGFAKARVRLPYSLIYSLQASSSSSLNPFAGSSSLLFGTFRSDSSDRLAPILILVALFIALVSAVVVVYQCGSAAGWSKSAREGTANPLALAAANHFGKEKFLFSPPPPAVASGFHDPLGAHFIHDSQGRASFNLSGSQAGTIQSQQTSALDQETIYQLSAAARAKEYETQMLKMSVLFDDNQSFDDQNLHDDQKPNTNLV